jgi:hypothetical protein
VVLMAEPLKGGAQLQETMSFWDVIDQDDGERWKLLKPHEQQEVADDFFDKHVASQEGFSELKPNQQYDVRKDFYKKYGVQGPSDLRDSINPLQQMDSQLRAHAAGWANEHPIISDLLQAPTAYQMGGVEGLSAGGYNYQPVLPQGNISQFAQGAGNMMGGLAAQLALSLINPVAGMATYGMAADINNQADQYGRNGQNMNWGRTLAHGITGGLEGLLPGAAAGGVAKRGLTGALGGMPFNMADIGIDQIAEGHGMDLTDPAYLQNVAQGMPLDALMAILFGTRGRRKAGDMPIGRQGFENSAENIPENIPPAAPAEKPSGPPVGMARLRTEARMMEDSGDPLDALYPKQPYPQEPLQEFDLPEQKRGMGLEMTTAERKLVRKVRKFIQEPGRKARYEKLLQIRAEKEANRTKPAEITHDQFMDQLAQGIHTSSDSVKKARIGAYKKTYRKYADRVVKNPNEQPTPEEAFAAEMLTRIDALQPKKKGKQAAQNAAQNPQSNTPQAQAQSAEQLLNQQYGGWYKSTDPEMASMEGELDVSVSPGRNPGEVNVRMRGQDGRDEVFKTTEDELASGYLENIGYTRADKPTEAPGQMGLFNTQPKEEPDVQTVRIIEGPLSGAGNESQGRQGESGPDLQRHPERDRTGLDSQPVSQPQGESEITARAHALHQQATPHVEGFKQDVQDIANETGLHLNPDHLKSAQKSPESIASKLQRKGPDYEPTDLLRTTYRIDPGKDTRQTVDATSEAFRKRGYEVVEVENRYDNDEPGYKDIKIIVKKNGVHSEIQLNYPHMQEAKDHLGGHDTYNETRDLQSRKDRGEQLTPKEQRRLDTETKVMNGLYEMARRLDARSSSTSADSSSNLARSSGDIGSLDHLSSSVETRSTKPDLNLESSADISRSSDSDSTTSLARDQGVMKMPLDQIRTKENLFQFREGLDKERVKRMAENMRKESESEFNAKLDPLVVWKSPDGSHYLLSGHHRLAALKQAGKPDAPVKVFEGTLKEARDFAAASNETGKGHTDLELSRIIDEALANGDNKKDIANRINRGIGQVNDLHRLKNLKGDWRTHYDRPEVKAYAKTIAKAVEDYGLSKKDQQDLFKFLINEGNAKDVTPSRLQKLLPILKKRQEIIKGETGEQSALFDLAEFKSVGSALKSLADQADGINKRMKNIERLEGNLKRLVRERTLSPEATNAVRKELLKAKESFKQELEKIGFEFKATKNKDLANDVQSAEAPKQQTSDSGSSQSKTTRNSNPAQKPDNPAGLPTSKQTASKSEQTLEEMLANPKAKAKFDRMPEHIQAQIRMVDEQMKAGKRVETYGFDSVTGEHTSGTGIKTEASGSKDKLVSPYGWSFHESTDRITFWAYNNNYMPHAYRIGRSLEHGSFVASNQPSLVGKWQNVYHKPGQHVDLGHYVGHAIDKMPDADLRAMLDGQADGKTKARLRALMQSKGDTRAEVFNHTQEVLSSQERFRQYVISELPDSVKEVGKKGIKNRIDYAKLQVEYSRLSDRQKRMIELLGGCR